MSRRLLVVLLSILIIVVATAIVFRFWQLTNVVTEKDVSEERDFSEEVRETSQRMMDTFWIEGDYEATQALLQEQVEQIKKRNEASGKLSAQDLNDEMYLMLNYAAITRRNDPEKGLRLYAEIFHNSTYTPTVRADALFHAMLFVAEKLRGGELTPAEANAWVFSPGQFGGVLEELGISPSSLDSAGEMRTAAYRAIEYSANLSESRAVSIRNRSVANDLEIAQEITDVHSTLSPAEQEVFAAFIQDSVETKTFFDTKLEDTTTLDTELSNMLINEDTYSDTFTLELIHALKNVMRAYNSLQYAGYDVYNRVLQLHNVGQLYIRDHFEDLNVAESNHANIQRAVMGLRISCALVQDNNFSYEEADVMMAEQYLEPFFQLPSNNQARLSVLNTIANDPTDACREAFAFLGSNIPAFKDVLIERVGGWEEDQFSY